MNVLEAYDQGKAYGIAMVNSGTAPECTMESTTIDDVTVVDHRCKVCGCWTAIAVSEHDYYQPNYCAYCGNEVQEVTTNEEHDNYDKSCIEEKFIEALKNIWNEYKEYNPNGHYIHATMMDDCFGRLTIMANNRCWEGGEDERIPIQIHCTEGCDEE